MHGQTDRQKDASDFIICPMLSYSNGTDNKIFKHIHMWTNYTELKTSFRYLLRHTVRKWIGPIFTAPGTHTGLAYIMKCIGAPNIYNILVEDF